MVIKLQQRLIKQKNMVGFRLFISVVECLGPIGIRILLNIHDGAFSKISQRLLGCNYFDKKALLWRSFFVKIVTT